MPKATHFLLTPGATPRETLEQFLTEMREHLASLIVDTQTKIDAASNRDIKAIALGARTAYENIEEFFGHLIIDD